MGKEINISATNKDITITTGKIAPEVIGDLSNIKLPPQGNQADGVNCLLIGTNLKVNSERDCIAIGSDLVIPEDAAPFTVAIGSKDNGYGIVDEKLYRLLYDYFKNIS